METLSPRMDKKQRLGPQNSPEILGPKNHNKTTKMENSDESVQD
jgi:hypothetical protein